MITMKKYSSDDYNRIIHFLRMEYLKNKDQRSWLAQRWEDMEYRVNELYTKERNGISWHEYIMLWEDNHKIVAICNNEGGRECFMHISQGYEDLFPDMLTWAEENISYNPYKFEGKRTLSVFALDSQRYRTRELEKRGYIKKTDEYSFFKSIECDKKYKISVPDGYKVVVGTEGMNHKEITNACGYGFHPECEGTESNDGDLAPCWRKREQAPMFDYRYESIAIAPDGEVASYSYCWVDKETNTGYIEPVSTREAYRRKGLGKAIQYATLNTLYEDGVDKCYVNPWGEHRDKYYSSCGYKTEDYEYVWEKEF